MVALANYFRFSFYEGFVPTAWDTPGIWSQLYSAGERLLETVLFSFCCDCLVDAGAARIFVFEKVCRSHNQTVFFFCFMKSERGFYWFDTFCFIGTAVLRHFFDFFFAGRWWFSRFC